MDNFESLLFILLAFLALIIQIQETVISATVGDQFVHFSGAGIRVGNYAAMKYLSVNWELRNHLITFISVNHLFYYYQLKHFTNMNNGIFKYSGSIAISRTRFIFFRTFVN